MATAIACGEILVGCLGAGDDTVSLMTVVGDGGTDARAADGAHSDGPSGEASARDGAGVDATQAVDARESGAVDATLRDRADGGLTAEAGAVAVFVSAPIDFLAVNCGGMSAQTLVVQNRGSEPLAVSAVIANGGGVFQVTPASSTVDPQGRATLMISALVPSMASAGDRVTGSLNLFTNDPGNRSVTIPLYATATGAFLGGTGSLLGAEANGKITLNFPATKLQTTAAPIAVPIMNYGNADVTIAFAPLNDAGVPSPGESFLLVPPPGTSASAVTLHPGATWTGQAMFTPVCSIGSGAMTCPEGPFPVSITPVGAICGNGGLSTLELRGQGTNANVTGCPRSMMTFRADCGPNSTPPAPNSFLLKNTGPVPAQVTGLSADGGFSVSTNGATVIGPDGGTLQVTVTAPTAPPFLVSPTAPAGVPPPPIQGALSVQWDVEDGGCTVPITESPSGAVLSFDTTTSPTCTTPNVASFSDFGSAGILLPGSNQTHNVCVKNSGSASAGVTLSVVSRSVADGGAGDATAIAGTPEPFAIVGPATFQVAASPATSQPTQLASSVSFEPQMYGGVTAQLRMAVDTTTVLCAPLPAPMAVTGFGTGGGPTATPTSLTFAAPCDGATLPGGATGKQVVLSNAGTLDLSFLGVAVSGAGASRFTVSGRSPMVLHPGDNTSITVQASDPIPSAAGDGGVAAPSLTELAAQLTILTDVPNSNPVVSLQEIPVGDQLTVSASNLQFGAIPVGSATSPQVFTITNAANADPTQAYQTANLSLSLQGADVSAYAGVPTTVSLAPGATTAPANVAFLPTSNIAYPAKIVFGTTDLLCAPLPPPITLVGTGTQGIPSVDVAALVFGQDPTDLTDGFVDCARTGPSKSFTITNHGNQPFTVKGLAFDPGKGTMYRLVPSPPILPAALGVSGTPTDHVTFFITPSPIPSIVPDPSHADFNDNLTIETSLIGVALPKIAMKMKARGAVITPPTTIASWQFQTVAFGSIGVIPNPFQNSGNASATVQLALQSQASASTSSIFGLSSDPTTLVASQTTSVVGQFVPPLQDGNWTDQGNLLVTAGAFCGALPSLWTTVSPAGSPTTTWQSPSFSLGGNSKGGSPVSASDSLDFGASQCGDHPPPSKSITLTNIANQAFPVTATLQSAIYYTVAVNGAAAGDGGTGTLPANGGTAFVTVTPRFVTPGPGVVPGSAPYADSVFITVGPPAAPVWTSVFPISWQLNGAVLALGSTGGSLPGPPNTFNGHRFYVADSNGTNTVPIANTGNQAATVLFGIPPPPSGNYTVTPSSTVSVPVTGATPQLFSTSGAPPCASQGPANTTLTLTTTGPGICQPLQDPVGGVSGPSVSVSILACTGTF